jgi:NAD(P)-dependent dehydrogenase (short-subunit alcohol dehydrogenase family)
VIDGLFRLEGRRALVTGGGGGIGTALSLGLARAGAAVAAADCSRAGLAQAEAAAAAENLTLHTLEADVSRLESIAEMVDQAVARLGGLDVLCNAAGIQVRKPALEVTEQDWDRLLATNLRGTFFACQKAAPYLKRERGAIVNIASITSQYAITGISAYSASKSGVAQLTRSLAVEWAPDIRVNAVAPGYIRTPMTADVTSDPARASWILERIPLGRLGSPEDVVGPVIFLASNAAAYVTGQVLFVDGGWVAC